MSDDGGWDWDWVVIVLLVAGFAAGLVALSDASHPDVYEPPAGVSPE